MNYITTFYENLFGHPNSTNISLNLENVSIINDQKRMELLKEFSMEEIKTALFSNGT